MNLKEFFKFNKFKIILAIILFLYFTNAYFLIPARVEVFCITDPCTWPIMFVPSTMLLLPSSWTLLSALFIFANLLLFYSISCYIFLKRDIFRFRKSLVLPFIIIFVVLSSIVLYFQYPKLETYNWNVWIWWNKFLLTAKHLLIPLINTVISSYFIASIFIAVKNHKKI